jgi:hypothetical protein
MSKYRNQTQTDEGGHSVHRCWTALRPKTIDARDINTSSLPTTGSQDTQQNEQDDNMSDNGQLWGIRWRWARGKYWSVLKDEGDNYIDPFYGGEDDDASVLNDQQ